MSYILRPNGIGDGGTDYTPLLSDDGDTSYISNTTIEGFPIDDLPSAVHNVTGFRFVFVARNSGASTTSGIVGVILSGSQSIGTPDDSQFDVIPCGPTYTTIATPISRVCAWTGLPWTVAQINALYISWFPELSGSGLRVTEFYLELYDDMDLWAFPVDHDFQYGDPIYAYNPLSHGWDPVTITEEVDQATHGFFDLWQDSVRNYPDSVMLPDGR